MGKPVSSVFRIVKERTGQTMEDPMPKVLKEGAVIGLDNHTILVKDGTEVPIDDSSAPIKDKDGKVVGVVLVFRDITERKRAEEKLAASQEELNSIMRNVPDIIYRLDPDGCFTFASSAIKKYGYQPEDLIGSLTFEIKLNGWEIIQRNC